VLVLERHFKLGGFTHAFRRGAWSWDVGLHYVGGMQEGSPMRRRMDLVTGGAVRWNAMPDRFERFVYPEVELEVPSDPVRYRAALAARFPEEARAIDAYFEDLRRAAGWATRHLAGAVVPAPLAALLDLPGRSLALQTTGAYLARRFRDPLLRAVLCSQWGDYGLPPSRSAFAVHAVVAHHYLHGASYPEGGAGTIAEAAAARIEAAGGSLRVNHEVEEILVEGGAAVGVRVRPGRGAEPEEHRAPLVFSNAGADLTFARLLPPALRQPAAPPAEGTSAVTLYLGLSGSPEAVGLHGENVWIFSRPDHDALFAERNLLLEGKVGALYLSTPSLKDPLARAHTAEVITHMDAEPFAAWRDAPWRRRGADYEALKARVTDALLAAVERRIPGFRALVAHAELSTPLTMEHFGGQRRGLFYGIPSTPERFRSRRCGVRTPVRNLLLTGADAGSLGIAGALMGGVLAAAASMGARGMPLIQAAARRGPARLAGPQRAGEGKEAA
jgi:phytoene dehydrogenase-like protein